jgi:hypothetical protein
LRQKQFKIFPTTCMSSSRKRVVPTTWVLIIHLRFEWTSNLQVATNHVFSIIGMSSRFWYLLLSSTYRLWVVSWLSLSLSSLRAPIMNFFLCVVSIIVHNPFLSHKGCRQSTINSIAWCGQIYSAWFLPLLCFIIVENCKGDLLLSQTLV